MLRSTVAELNKTTKPKVTRVSWGDEESTLGSVLNDGTYGGWGLVKVKEIPSRSSEMIGFNSNDASTSPISAEVQEESQLFKLIRQAKMLQALTTVQQWITPKKLVKLKENKDAKRQFVESIDEFNRERSEDEAVDDKRPEEFDSFTATFKLRQRELDLQKRLEEKQAELEKEQSDDASNQAEKDDSELQDSLRRKLLANTEMIYRTKKKLEKERKLEEHRKRMLEQQMTSKKQRKRQQLLELNGGEEEEEEEELPSNENEVVEKPVEREPTGEENSEDNNKHDNGGDYNSKEASQQHQSFSDNNNENVTQLVNDVDNVSSLMNYIQQQPPFNNFQNNNLNFLPSNNPPVMNGLQMLNDMAKQTNNQFVNYGDTNNMGFLNQPMRYAGGMMQQPVYLNNNQFRGVPMVNNSMGMLNQMQPNSFGYGASGNFNSLMNNNGFAYSVPLNIYAMQQQQQQQQHGFNNGMNNMMGMNPLLNHPNGMVAMNPWNNNANNNNQLLNLLALQNSLNNSNNGYHMQQQQQQQQQQYHGQGWNGVASGSKTILKFNDRR